MALFSRFVSFSFIVCTFSFLAQKLTLPVSDFSEYTAPVDVALWTQTVSGVPCSGSDLFSFDQSEEFSEMARNFFSLPKDDEQSISSSMGDSAYMSQPDTGKRHKNDKAAFQVPQDTRSHIMEPFVYSPTLSTGSHGTFQGSQPDLSHVMLPPAVSSDMSEFANYSHAQTMSPTDFSFRQPMLSGQSSWANTEMPSYSTPFAASSVEAPFMSQRQSSYPSRAVQPFFASYSYGIDSMISNSCAEESRMRTKRVDFEQPTAAPSAVQRPLMQRQASTESRARSDVMSPASTVMTAPFSMFQGGSEYEGEGQSYMQMTGSDSFLDNTASDILNSSTMTAEEDDEENRSSEEAEVKLARTHPLYQATTRDDDDMYHCPYEGQANCMHRPTKLKCNYDKYVDSHLKPFRCKNTACINVEFSSTACLLRHEREAHGMHGHGSKPHLCAYPDCERAIPGNGFPRRYNLYDHMKRVHDYTSPAQEPGSPKGGAQAKRPASRKRKSAGSAEQTNDKRQKTTAAQTKQANLARQKQDLERERLRNDWAERMAMLQHRLKGLDEPKDIEGHQQIIDDAAALQKIVLQLTDMG
ncbi:uncharacterized protein K452DRAFT_47028 [Aplosporella prunicola CBS 121167]|uniref:C2H2-type domain-containing protein n=1 Tax=Aplosporella prunicola CBS 121167 TaxID=1176127 RepID=A0A6A6B8I3_9PEZI|nr:uncharacterized protein K452DRAFT_47028 [Aplosporella prunicola CBS 121167]KAF2140469.1 hypothetical protein K452DRAFT_47028 [Aplosporella prunicola CBS 121167]